MKRDVIICIGSNVTDGENKVTLATEKLSRILESVEPSKIYTTKGEHSPGKYFNRILKAKTDLELDSLQKENKKIEQELGRIKNCKNIDIDIDIVVFEGEIIRPQDYASNYFKQGINILKEKR